MDFDEPVIHKVKPSAPVAATANAQVPIKPRPCVLTDRAPVLLVTPLQPQGPSVSFCGDVGSLILTPPPKPVTATPFMPGKSGKPCSACGLPQCGGQRKRYTLTVENKKKMFTFCPKSGKSTTAGFENIQYNDYEHFKRVVDEKLCMLE